MLRLRPNATYKKKTPSDNFSFVKITFLNGCLEVERRRTGIALAENLCDLEGEITLAEALAALLDW
jgi:hypothetical protein